MSPARPRGPVRGRLAETPPEDRPREKLFLRGPEALSDEELLALVLGTGSMGRPVMELAREMLASGGLRGLFTRGAAGLKKLVPGVSDAKAARVAAVLEIGKRLARVDLASRDLLSDPKSAASFLVPLLAGETAEVMGALLLDAKNHLIRNVTVFRGTGSHASVSPSPLFRHAIIAGAMGVILYHNHPSGDPEPSADDRATTQRFVEAGRQIGIEVKDHLVVGQGRVVSFQERGLLPR
jgi:DNA repair protein RadC